VVVFDNFDVFDAALLQDPYPTFEKIRAEAPVLRLPHAPRPTYLVTAHPLAVEILERPAVYSSDTHTLLTSGSSSAAEIDAIYAQGWPEVPTMISTDGTEHNRFRAAIHHAFTVANVRSLVPMISAAVDELIDGFIADGECDFLERFAIPLPLYVISDILGVDRAEHMRLKRWSDAFILRNGKMGTLEEELQAARDILECQLFFKAVMEDRRRHPRTDLITSLVEGKGVGEPLSDAEILSVLGMILVGGNETTRSTLAGMIGRLLAVPEQAAILRREPQRLINAIDEGLRYESPAASTWRIAKQGSTIGPVDVPSGSVLMVRLDAANRDPDVFQDPHTFNIARNNASMHVAFGRGSHFCIGQLLARRELAVAIPRLLERLADVRLDIAKTDLTNRPVLHVRSVRSIHLVFTPGKQLGIAKNGS
jgi:cytochrome P450